MSDFYIGIVLARSQGDKPYARYPIQRACPHVSPKWTEWLMVVLVVSWCIERLFLRQIERMG